jgi:hypothetical protein
MGQQGKLGGIPLRIAPEVFAAREKEGIQFPCLKITDGSLASQVGDGKPLGLREGSGQ